MEHQKKVTSDNVSLDDTAKFINPEEIIDGLGICEGMLVGDFGCGTGYFTFPLSRKVGASGRIFALDILKAKLEVVESEARVLGLNNVSIKRVNLDMENGSRLDSDSLDWVFLITMLFQNNDHSVIFEEVFRVLKKGGKFIVAEWKEDSPFGPEKKLRISKEVILQLAKKFGFVVINEIQISDFHFGIILQK